MSTLVLTCIVIALAMLGLAVGLLLTGKCFRGGCGSQSTTDEDGRPNSCACRNERVEQIKKQSEQK